MSGLARLLAKKITSLRNTDLVLERKRFYVDENIYKHLINNPKSKLIINVVPNLNVKYPHPKGKFIISNEKAIKFIESKKFSNNLVDDNGQKELTNNWRNNSNWHSYRIPQDLVNFFEESL